MKEELLIESITDNPAINLALDTIKIGKQALVFVGTRPGSEKSAEEVAKRVNFGAGKGDEIRKLAKLAKDVLHSLDSPTRQCERLSNCLKKGIAFHHSGLTAKQRELVEENFRKGVIKIICNTPSLAMGVDLPAYRSIIRDLKRFTQHGYDWIPVLEYHQMSGRAGRPTYDKEGQAIIFAKSEGEAEELEEKFINGKPEEIYSKLAVEPVLRSYLLSLIASRIVTNKQEILAFFEKTFWAYQFKDMAKLEKIINKMLALLEQWEFIKLSAKSEFVSASELDEGKIVATMLGNRVAELYLDPLTAYNLINGLKISKSRGINPFTLLHLVSYTSELKPLLKVKVKEHDDVQNFLLEHEQNLLAKEPSLYESEYEEFLASVKTAMFFNSWIEENSEEVLLENYNIRPGEIRAKLANADWLLYSLTELARILQLNQQLKEITKLRFRMKYGVMEELLSLLQLKNIGRVRSRKLFSNRIKTIADVKKADVATLTQILGSGKVALDVKKQLGQEVKEVPSGKRKGQTSISKY
ncbi:hypothetical protein CMO88_04675 [Candidatus Woesearchaeota archaeon]|nr:hypothetical protein [Candidatus Woesearchaeota archaeon]|tara:strand:+ start:1921 stop:3498 length:1578 start_codon:yes stop_codon:yes gene_type:complete